MKKLTVFDLNNMSENDQLDFLHNHLYTVLFIKNPSQKIVYYVVSRIERIRGPLKIDSSKNHLLYKMTLSEQVQVSLIKQKGYQYIAHIKNPARQAIVAVIDQTYNYDWLKFLKLSEDMKYHIVFNHPITIKYFENPSEKIQKTAVFHSAQGSAIELIENPCKEAQRIALLKGNVSFLEKLEYIDEEISLLAVKMANYTVAWLPEITPRVLDALLEDKDFPIFSDLKSIKYLEKLRTDQGKV